MDQVKILIVEDDIVQSLKMAQDLKSMNYQVVGRAVNAQKAMELILQESPDLILVDINLTGRPGDYTGIALGKQITEKHALPFIYITAMEDNATFQNAISSKPQHYIVKPYRKEELYRAIEIAMLNFVQTAEPATPDDFIVVKDNHYLRKIFFKDITWIEAAKDLKKIHTTKTNHFAVAWATMEELEEKLKADTFVRIHRSYIVNLDHVSRYKGGYVHILDEKISVGRAYKDNLNQKLEQRNLL